MNKLFIVVPLLLLIPVASAEIKITEIMYNLKGADSGREWIELYNNGSEANITGWKFYESETNHRLKPFQGDLLLSAGEYAIIADKPEMFLKDWTYSGTIIDSTFSLLNKGEIIIIKDSNKVDVFLVDYVSSLGADGDGNSLQLIDNEWIACEPTPGRKNTCDNEKKLMEEIVENPIKGELINNQDNSEQSEPVVSLFELEINNDSDNQESNITEIKNITPAIKNELQPIPTGSVVYESKKENQSLNLALYFVLIISITLNILLIFSLFRKNDT